MLTLTFLLLLTITTITHGYVKLKGEREEVTRLMLNVLEKTRTDLTRPIIPDSTVAVSDKTSPVYEIKVWDESSSDFYHPYSFNMYGGHRKELYVDMIFEDRIDHLMMSGNQSLALTIANLQRVKVIAWTGPKQIFLRKISPMHKYVQVISEGLVFSNMLSLDNLVIFNGNMQEEELYLFGLSKTSHGQKITTFKVDLITLTLRIESELYVEPYVSKIRIVSIPTLKYYLVVAVRHMNAQQSSSCTSDVFQVTFTGQQPRLLKLQGLFSQGAVDAESFTINGITYLAIANSFCPTSDVFVFDTHVNGFYLYQRLDVTNATDFEYFSIGFRHFLGVAGIDTAVIYEWQGESWNVFQRFYVPPHIPVQKVRRWHYLRLPQRDQALLLLVKSQKSVDLIKWSKVNQRFVTIIRPICVSWFRQLGELGLRAFDNEPLYDLTSAQIECILAENACAGVSEIRGITTKFVPEGTSEFGSTMKTSSPNELFWFKKLDIGLSCFTANNTIGMAQILSYVVEDLVYIVVPFQNYATTLIVKTHSADVRETSFRASVSQRIRENEKTLHGMEQKLKQLENRNIPPNVITRRENYVISAPVAFNTSVKAYEHFTVDTFVFHNTIEGEPKLNREWDLKLNELNQLIKDFLLSLNDAIRLDEPQVNIDQKIHFRQIKVLDQFVAQRAAYVRNINHVPLIQLLNSVVTYDQLEPVLGRKIFLQPVQFDDVNVINPIAGHLFPHDIVTKTTVQVFQGMWYFDETVSIDSVKTTYINGIDLTHSVTSVYLNRTVTYAAPKIFNDRLVIEGNIIVEKINNIDIKELNLLAVNRNGNQIITGKKIFRQNVHVTGNLGVTGRLNGFEIPFLDKVIVRQDQPGRIVAHKRFKMNAFFNKNVYTNGLLNHQKFPNNYILRNSSVASITAPKEFTTFLDIQGNVVIDGGINNVQFSDIVTLHTPQEILYPKVFKGGLKLNNITIHGTLDGMTVENLKDIAYGGRPLPHPSDNYHTLDLKGDLKDVRYLNGIPITELVKQVVFKGDINVRFTEEVVLTQTTKVIGEVFDLTSINAFNLHTDFLNKDELHEIKGHKMFSRQVTFLKGFVVDGLVDGVNLTEFKLNAVTLDTVQEITGTVTFHEDVNITSVLKVNGFIDSVKIPEDVVMVTGAPKKIVSRKTFFHGIHSHVLDTTTMKVDFINDVEWRHFENERITLSTPQDIFGQFTFLHDVTIGGNLRVIGRINEVDVNSLTRDAMSKSKPQTITGFKTISSVLTADHIITPSGFPLVDLKTLASIVVKINPDNLISEPLSFNEVNVVNIMTVEKVNGFQLTELLTDAVQKTGEMQHITGLKDFRDGLSVIGNVDVIKINDLHPAIDIFIKSLPQNITGPYELTEVEVIGSVTLHGKINGRNLTDYQKHVVKVNGDVYFPTVTLESGLVVEHHINVSSTVNNIALSALMADVVFKSPSSDVTEIVASKHFIGPVIVHGNIIVDGHVNNMKLSSFINDIVLIVGNQEIHGEKKFLSNITLSGDLRIAGNLTISGSVKGINLDDLLKSVVYLDVPQTITGHKIFTAPIDVRGNVIVNTVNNIKLPEDVVRRRGDQPIFGVKTFEHVVVEEYVQGENVNGEVIEHLYDDTLFQGGYQHVTGHKTFNFHSSFKQHVNVLGKTCGIDFGKEVVTIGSDQKITGKKVMHNMNIIGKAEIKSLNKFDMNIMPSLWTLIQKPVYEAHYIFRGITRFSSVKLPIEEPLDSTVDDLIESVHYLKPGLESSAFNVARQYHAYERMWNSLKFAAVKLDHFRHLQQLDVEKSIGYEHFTAMNRLFLITRNSKTTCESDLVMTWDGAYFRRHGELKSGRSTHWHHFSHSDNEYIVVSEPNNACGRQSRILRYNYALANFELYCNLGYWFHQSTSLLMGDSLYIAAVHKMYHYIFRIELNIFQCNIFEILEYRSGADLVVPFELFAGFAFGILDRKLMMYHFNGTQFFDTAAPGLNLLTAVSSWNKQYLITSSWLPDVDVTVIKVLEVKQIENGLSFDLIKQIHSKPSRPALSLKIFSVGLMDEFYLAILYKKTGVSITKLDGFEKFDKVTLPIAAADVMDVFTSNGVLYLILNAMGESKRSHLFHGQMKGSRVHGTVTP